MNKILGFLTQRWFLTLLGVISLSLFIWFLGPLFAFAGYVPLDSEYSRLIAIGFLFLIWLVSRIWALLRARKKSSNIMQGMVATTPEPALTPAEQASEEELEILKERMEEALGELKNARLGRGSRRQFLYQQPWYIIIGPPGSGKTTLLRNSKLKFPLAERFGDQAIRGIGGTRNCDWWFTDDAILLDTAGRYTTQDSQEEVDRKAWLGFLELLKKHRRRRPINGVIIAISIADLLQSSESQRHAHARAIRNRINELHENLGIRFPIYLLFTKCDLLEGFREYFDDLDREARSQVWGMTFPLSEGEENDVIKHFGQEFELLEKRLHGQLIDKLEHEKNLEKRNLIYTFPQQFGALKNTVDEFLQAIFQASRYEQPAMIRGVYFTSATQEGTPIDRIMGSLANSFGMSQQALSGRSASGISFFINRLLKDLIFSESGLAGANLKLEKKRIWLQRGAFAATAAAVVLILLAWLFSYVNNRSYIQMVEQDSAELNRLVAQLDKNQNDILATLPLLNKARNIPGGYNDQKKGHSLWMNFGLYQGDKLGKAAVITYKRLLRQAFLSRLIKRLEQQILNNGNNTDYLFEALKVYLMLDDPEHFDSDTVRAWISLDWDETLPLEVSNKQRSELADHLATLFETQPVPLPRPLDTAVIDNARAILARTPLANRIYRRLKLEFKNSDSDIPDFRINDAAGREAPLVFSRKSGDPVNSGISGLFTYAGYHQWFLPRSRELARRLADESWILGPYQVKPTDEEIARLTTEVNGLYFEEFIREWEALLADLRIVPFSSSAQAVEVLGIISGERSPLKSLLEAVARETTLNRVEATDESNAANVTKANGKFSAAKEKLNALFSRSSRANKTPRLPSEADKVYDKFKRLNETVESKDGSPPPLNQTLAALNELYIYMNAILQASGEELVLEQRKQIDQVLQKLKIKARRQPAPISTLLNDIANSSTSLVGGGICQHLDAVWRSEVLDFYKAAIAGRYPINRNATLEVTQEDFGLFFGPQGKLESFFNKYLAASVDKTGTKWRWRNTDGSPACVSDATLRQFKRADRIKTAFFRSGGQIPSFSFSLKPLSMSTEITQLNLNIDGQRISYAHGPIRSVPMKWPGPNNSGQISLSFSPPEPGGRSGLTLEGPWALFHLLDQANLQRLGRSEQFTLTFNLGGRDASFELRAGSAINPFNLDALQKFRCPQHL